MNEIYLISFCVVPSLSPSFFFPVRIISFICAHPNGSKSEREISKRMDSEEEKRNSLFFVFFLRSCHDNAEKLNASSLYYLL